MPDDARMLLGLAPKAPAGLDHLGVSGRAENLAVYPSRSTEMSDMRGMARTARQIEVLAVRGLGILGMNDSILRAGVRGGAPDVSVLLLDPDCDAARRRSAEIGEAHASLAAGIRVSIERLRELAEETGTVRCRLNPLLPTWRVTEDAEVLVRVLGALGAREIISFVKHCTNYRFGSAGPELLATVVTVPELAGQTFVELETVAESDELDEALDVVRAVLGELGIGPDDFTTEQYTDAVAARRGR